MEERKHWLLSRKFWLALLTAVTFLVYEFTSIELDPEIIIGIILPILAYILGESYVDAQAIKLQAELVALKTAETKLELFKLNQK